MQRNREQRALFIAKFVASQIEVLRNSRKIFLRLVLGENKEREAFCKRTGDDFTVDDFLERTREFVAQTFRRFETGGDRFVNRPERFAGDEWVHAVAPWPVGQHPIGQERIVKLLHAALENFPVFRVPRFDVGQIRQKIREQTVTEQLRRNLVEATVRILENQWDAGDFRQPRRS